MTRLLACGMAIEVWALAALWAPPGADLARHVGLTLAAWAVYVVALRTVLVQPSQHPQRELALIFGVAFLVRATLLLTTPSLSDDVYRAVWDARLLHQGINPYDYAPAAPELAGYRDDTIWPRVNHPEQRTPYPPLAELLGAAAYAVLPERLLAMQVLAASMDLLSAALLAGLLARSGADPRRCIIVAWSPVGAMHFAHSGHNDAAMVAAMVGAALLLTLGHRGLALVALGAATMIKAVPALTLPAFTRAAGLRSAVVWAATCAMVTLPFLGAGAGLVAGALTEAGGQRFNDSTFFVVERVVAVVAPGAAIGAAIVFGAAMLGVAAVLSWTWGASTGAAALAGGSRVLAVYLLVAPVVEPWYLTWLAPLIALNLEPAGRGSFALNDAAAWLWLTGAAVLTELTYLPGGSALWPAIRLVEYGPAYGILALVALRYWHAREKGAKPQINADERR